MHIALNAWFWDRPDTGSGQYIRELTRALVGGAEGRPPAAPDAQITLIAPDGLRDINPPPGAAVIAAPLRGRGQWAKLRFEQQDFPQAARRAGADLIHTPYWAPPLSSPLPVVVTIHDLIPLLLPEYRGGGLARLYTGLAAASARGAAAVITDSRASGEDILTHLGIPAGRIYPIPLAVPAQYHPRPGSLLDLAVRKKYALPPEYVLYLGGYDVRKNVETLLRAYTYVRTGTEAPLVLAGRLPTRRSPRFLDVQAAIARMGLAESVQVIGEVDEEDKPALYRLARTVAFPSRYEGFGLPVLEAMACGRPVIAGNTPALVELLGDAGFAVDPDDARHMGGAILATLTQDNLNQELGQKALARAAQFSWARTAAETAAVYRQVLQAGAAA